MEIRRILITGSRTWTDTSVIREALAAVWHPEAVLVVGACPRGADLLTEQCWTHWGGRVERWPADWSGPCGTECPAGHRRVRRGASICPRAGYVRNHAMIAAGADVCLAFIRARSRGASHCACWVELAGIPTVVYAAA